ncbi:helix-turn-helix domain-containing protein [Dactylosporangium sp. CA-139066]|uniref:helix-turn-helix domain-containing protein n=1 Tax=Dactylosporangium sp. CA-139066 TaxID=3239930 RepID=UPI003D8F1451
MSDIGGRVHALRTARGLTQRQLAEPRYTAAYVSSVEAGRRTPSTDALAHFAHRLGVSRQQLLTGREDAAGVLLVRALTEADLAALSDVDGARSAYQSLTADPEVAAGAHEGLGRLALDAGDTAAALECFAAAEEAGAGRPPHLRAGAVAGRAACVRAQGDVRYAAYLLSRAVEELHAAGLPDPAALLMLNADLAVYHAQAGEWDAAARSAEAALALAGPDDPVAAARGHLAVAGTLLAAGDERGAEPALAQARAAIGAARLRPALARCRWLRGRALAAAGAEHAVAQADLASAEADLAEAHRRLPGDGAVAADLALVLRALGRGAEAARLLESTVDGPAVAHARARLALDGGDAAGAEGHLRAAADGYRAAGDGRELATVVLALGDLLDAGGRAEEAANLLHAGLRDVEQISAARAPAATGTAPAPHR